MTLTFGSTSYGDSTSWSIATTTMDTSSTVGAIAIVGWNLAVSTTPTSTPMTTTLSSTSTASTASQTSTSSPSNSDSSGGLSSGAKAGIGVGVAVGAIGVIALIVAIFLLRRRKEKSVDGPTTPNDPQAPGQPPYNPGPSGQPPYNPSAVGQPPYGTSSSGQHSYTASSVGQPAPTDQISYNNTISTAQHSGSNSNTVVSSTQHSHNVSHAGMSEAGWQESQNWPAELDGTKLARHAGARAPVELSST